MLRASKLILSVPSNRVEYESTHTMDPLDPERGSGYLLSVHATGAQDKEATCGSTGFYDGQTIANLETNTY